MKVPNATDYESSRMATRGAPYGLVVSIEGNDLKLADGSVQDLGELYGNPSFYETNYQGWKLLWNLIDEVVLQRKVIIEMVREEGMRVTSPQNFHHRLASLASKIGEHPNDVRQLVEPILRQIFEEMLTPRPERHGRRSRRNRSR